MSTKRVAIIYFDESHKTSITVFDNFTLEDAPITALDKFDFLVSYLNNHKNCFISINNGEYRYIINTTNILFVIEAK